MLSEARESCPKVSGKDELSVFDCLSSLLSKASLFASLPLS